MMTSTKKREESSNLHYFYPKDDGSIIFSILPEEHFQKYNKLTVWDPYRKGGSKVIKAENLLVLNVTNTEARLLKIFFNNDYEYWHTKLPSFRMEDYPEAFV